MANRKLNFAGPNLPNLNNLKKRRAVDEKIQINPNFGSPLNPKPIISNSKGEFVDANLKLRQAQNEGAKNNVKNKQQQLSNEMTTTKVKSTTTKPASTTVSTSSSTPKETSTSGGKTSNQPNSTLNTQTTTMARNNNGNRGFGKGNKQQTTSTDNTENTSSYTTSSRYAPNTIGFTDPLIKDANLFGQKDTSSILGAIDGGNGAASKIPFDLNILCPTLLNDFETSSLDGPEIRPKLILKGTSFTDAIGGFLTSTTNNADYYQVLEALYHKFDSDIGNTLNSYTSPNWSLNNFIIAMTDTCRALEIYYTLDAILAYDPNSMGELNNNRCLLGYKYLFGTQTILSYKAQLRSYLKGMWFPPNFAQLIRWFYQNYKVNNLEQATCFRYVPSNLFFVSDTSSNTLLNTFNIDSTINNLKPGGIAAKISTIMNRVYRVGRIGTLPVSCSDITFDPVMTEIFLNDVVVFKDITNSNTKSCYPISYKSSANDIPYYMDQDPSQTSAGLGYALQSLGTVNTGTTGYVPDFYWGLRVPITDSIKDTAATPVVDITNTQYITNTNGLLGYSRSMSPSSKTVSVLGCHERNFVYPQSSATTNLVVKSQSPTNMQRVYFSNYNGPRLILGELVNQLFQTRA